MSVNGWYLDAVRFWRGLGFFADKADLPDAALADWAMQQAVRDWDQPMTPDNAGNPQAADMYLLMSDSSRVWFHDLEYVHPGTIQTLVETLQEWRDISRGAFQPTGIRETWHGDRGPADIEFALGGEPQRLTHRGGDMLDPVSMLGAINRMLGDSAIRFCVADTLGMPNFVVVLSEHEKAHVQRERHWSFVPLG